MTISTFCVVGVTRFELATPRPPDAYSNRTELHPERTCQNNNCFVKRCKGNTDLYTDQIFWRLFSSQKAVMYSNRLIINKIVEAQNFASLPCPNSVNGD